MFIAKSFSIAALAWAAFVPAALAHGDKAPAKAHAKAAAATKEQRPWGIDGDAKDAVRTIEVRMTDNMRFKPDRIEVKQGETIRFVVRNDGKMLHEMVIGTKQALDEHAAMMLKYPGMEHDEPYMAHVSPGKRGEIVWNFNRAGAFQFACLLPGHYEAGMFGNITVAPAEAPTARKSPG
jgi:uncharacterized cupredoxin-like copper-binding protein